MKDKDLQGKRLAVFGAGNVVDEVTAFARRHGIVLVSVGNVPEAPMHQVSDESYCLDCTDEAAMMRFFREKDIDGLLSCSSESVIRKTVGFIGRTGFPYYATPLQWDVLMNKRHFKEACLRYGMPAIPAFRPEDGDIPFPVIVKPVDNGGSFGVTVCRGRSGLEAAIDKAVRNSAAGDYLCEQYLEGPYFQFEIWRQDGKSYFPYTKERVFYEAVGASPRQPFLDLYPSPRADSIRRLWEPLSRLFDDLGVSNGSCMFQGILHDGEPYIMDNAFRLSGGMDFRVVREDKGVDLVAAYMQYALTGRFGDDFSPLSEPLHADYATLCIGLENGRIRRIRGIDTVQEQPFVYSIHQYYHEGDTMRCAGLFQQVLCRIFVRAGSRRELLRHVSAILGLIEVEGDDGRSLLRAYPRF